jgi:hypothetical protein
MKGLRALGAFGAHHLGGFFDGAEAAHSDADDDPGALGIGHGASTPGVGHRHAGRGDGELDEAVHLAGIFAPDMVGRLEVMDLAGDVHGVFG